MAKIGIVTVTYNSGEVLDEFMESILKQNHNDWILYVVDNDSKDNTLKVLAKYPDGRVVLIENKENYGVAKGNNQGIESALSDDCDYVLLLNNDTVFEENLISILLLDLVNNNADMVSPKMMYYQPNNVIWCAGGGFKPWQAMKNYHRGENEVDNEQYDKIEKCDYVPTCCVLVKSELFTDTSVGLMDEKYFVYFDDVDWMYRAKKNELKLIYTPNVRLLHKVSSITGGLSDFTMRLFFRNKIYFLRKNFAGIQLLVCIFYYIMLTFSKFIINRLRLNKFKLVTISLWNGFFL